MTSMGTFIEFQADQASSELQFKVPGVPAFRRFTSCFRIKACWMFPRTGTAMREVAQETQFLLLEKNESNARYTMMIPLLDGLFRCSLFADQDGDLALRAESMDSGVKTDRVCGVYVLDGCDPYRMMEQAAEDIMSRLQTGRLRKMKRLPEFMRYYGWCSYNAFYDAISHEKLIGILDRYREAGVQIGFMLVDAGWQTAHDRRLSSFEADPVKFPGGLKALAHDAKANYGLEKLLVWQTYNGFWSGVDAARLPQYDVQDTAPALPLWFKDVLANRGQPKGSSDAFSEATVGEQFYPASTEPLGLVSPDFYALYNDYHDYLRKQGVDGVKVDAMAWVELFGEGRGGRVEMMRRLLSAVESSTAIHFDGELLNCSSCSNDFIFQTLHSTVTRTSMDFFPNKPATHGLHIYANAHASFWMGEFVQPDWDMFQTGHESGEFHAAARAISGGPVYSTDVPGVENVALIKKLSHADGTVPLCESYARVCLDSLFVHPSKDREVIKIFNVNRFGGVVGAFNCCYAKDEVITVTGHIGVGDIPEFDGDRFAVYRHREQALRVVERAERLPVSLDTLQYELFTIAPIRNGFAAIGLADKFNSGGTVRALNYTEDGIVVEVTDEGEFVAYCASEPRLFRADGSQVQAYEYDPSCGKLVVRVKAGLLRIGMMEPSLIVKGGVATGISIH